MDRNALDKLADIEIKCKDGYLLREFELENKGKEIYWKYKCIQASTSICEEKFTNYKNAKFGKFFYRNSSFQVFISKP